LNNFPENIHSKLKIYVFKEFNIIFDVKLIFYGVYAIKIDLSFGEF
jgi:hypothetical protein